MKCIWLALIFAVVEISLAKKNQFARQVDNIKSNNIPLNNRPIIGYLFILFHNKVYYIIGFKYSIRNAIHLFLFIKYSFI